MTAEYTSNNFHTTLSGNGGSITSSQTTFNVSSVTGMPAFPFRMAMGPVNGDPTEIVLVTGAASLTLTATRGIEAVPGTGAGAGASHNDGDAVAAVITAAGLPNLMTLPVNVQTVFGAKGDGVTDDSAAFVAARNYIFGRRVVDVEDGGYRLLDQLFIPAGEYKITTAEALFTAFGLTTDYVNGYTIKGAGPQTTRIVFTPATYGALLHSTDQLRWLSCADISFYGGNAFATLFDSFAGANGEQKAAFTRCNFWGTWNDTFILEGAAAANNNDTWIFLDCYLGVTCGRTTAADGHVSSGTPNFTSATGNFTAADAANGGRNISIPGAGVAGAVLNTTIAAFVSSTAVTLAVNASTTVTTAATTIAAAFFHCGTQNGMTNQDQFLNYRFIGGDYALDLGDLTRFDYGGACTIADCSVEMSSTTALGNIFNLPTATHFGGVNSFTLRDARLQLDTANKIVTSAVKYGNLLLDNVSTDGFATPSNQVIATMYGSSGMGMLVSARSCRLTGQWEFQIDANTWNDSVGRHVFDNCVFPQQGDLQNFLVLTPIAGAGSAVGGYPIIDFVHCIGAFTYGSGTPGGGRTFEVAANWLTAEYGPVEKRAVSIKSIYNSLPWVGGVASIDVWLPLNCIITDVHFFQAGTPSGSAVWAQTLTTNEGSPTTLAVCSPGTALGTGFSVHVRDLWFFATTDAMRHLTLTATGAFNAVQAGTMCIIEYLPGS